jgi:hypothetical protein
VSHARATGGTEIVEPRDKVYCIMADVHHGTDTVCIHMKQAIL